jgi:DNA-binding winged helix-turn-helix (wHTH) protein/Flp pilus assembly protein TadD
MISQHQIYEFGRFRLDANERTLQRGNKPVPLTPKVFAVLLILVENSGHIVEKDELMRQVWPNSFVEEGNLTQSISLLRKALGKTADNKPYIETIARRGYRFSASVRKPGSHESESKSSSPQFTVDEGADEKAKDEIERSQRPVPAKLTALRRIKQHKRRFAAGLIALLAAVVIIGIWYTRNNPKARARRYVSDGNNILKQRTGDSLVKAEEKFKLAISADPNCAPAYAGLADTYVLKEEWLGIPTTETIPIAEEYANKAIEINPSLAEAHTSLAFIRTKQWRWDEAKEEFDLAINLNPSYPRAHHWYSLYLRIVGDNNTSLTEIKIARGYDPSSEVIRANLVIAYLLNDDLNEAIRQGDELLNLVPNTWAALSWRGMAYLEQGNKSEAISDLAAGAFYSKGSHTLVANLGYGYAVLGEFDKAEEKLKELIEKYGVQKATGQDIAKVYAGLKNNQEALKWLRKDFDVRSGDLPNISWHPAFKSLHDDQEFKELLRIIGLPRK